MSYLPDIRPLIISFTPDEREFLRHKVEMLAASSVQRLILFWFSGSDAETRERDVIGGSTGKRQPQVIRHRARLLLLRYLREFHESNHGGEAENRMREADILFRKALYKDAGKMYAYCLSRACKEGAFGNALEIMGRMMEIRQVIGKSISDRNLLNWQRKEEELVSSQVRWIRMRQHATKVFFSMRHAFGAGAFKLKKEVEDILKHADYSSERKPANFREGINYFQMHAVASKLKGDHEGAIRVHLQFKKFLERYIEQIRARPVIYLSVMNNLSLTYSTLGRPKDVLQCIRVLRHAPVKFGFKDSKDWRGRVFVSIYPLLHEVYIRNKLFSRADSVIHDTEQTLEKLGGLISPFHRGLIFYNLGYLYYGKNEPGSALKMLQKLWEIGKDNIRGDIYLNARLIELLIYLKKDDAEAFEYAALNLRRRLKPRDPDHRSIKSVLRYLQKCGLSRSTVDTERRAILKIWERSTQASTLFLKELLP